MLPTATWCVFKFIFYRKRTKRSAYMEQNSHANALEGLQGSSKLWIGKDYTNFIVKDFADLESPFTGKCIVHVMAS